MKIDNIPGRKDLLRARIFESVIEKSSHPHNYIRGEPEWTCRIGNREFKIKGDLYAQQNGITNVCAHVAIKTVISRVNKNITYKKMNDILGIDHKKKKIGITVKRGLNTDQIKEILKYCGFNYISADYTKGKEILPFQRYVYGSIESGYPSILCFKTGESKHAIPVLGHTWNADTWVPSAEFFYFKVGPQTKYIPSEFWMSMFICHDDNFGPYCCIPHHYLYTRRVCENTPTVKFCKNQDDQVLYVIGILPKDTEINAIEAEIMGIHYLQSILKSTKEIKGNRWCQRLNAYAQEGLIVLRPIIITFEEYSKHLEKAHNWEGKSFPKEIISSFSKKTSKVWMIELSLPDLFSANKRKLGEILIDVHKPKDLSLKSHENFYWARISNFFVFYHPISGSKYEAFPSGVDGHIEILGCE